MMDRKAVVLDYLEKCNTYAQASIKRKLERGEADETKSWESYMQFNDHAIEEISNGTLDHWFSPPPSENMSNAHRIDVDNIEHAQRAGWLSGLLPAHQQYPACQTTKQAKRLPLLSG